MKVISEHVSFDSKDSVFAVSGNTDVAGVFKEAGIQTYLISQENQKIPGVRSLKEWEELSKE